MALTETFVRRPVLATVINLVVLLVGFVSFNRLSVREYPNIDVPTITVETTYRGAPANVVESQITRPLEDQISGIEGINYMNSISRAESSQITVSFRLTRDADEAASDVRDKVNRALKALPTEADAPVVTKTEADAQPIIWLSINSTKHSLMEVSDYAARTVRDRLQIIPGVSSVRIFGERKPAMRIWLDVQKLAGFNLTPQDVEAALRAQNVDIPAGRVESAFREFTVRTQSDANTPEEFANLIVARKEGRLVRVADVARVEVAPAEERSYIRFNGINSLGLGIVKQSTANPLDVSDGLLKVLPEIQKNMPEGMKIQVAFNSSIFIRSAINKVYSTIAEAIILVAAVIFLFLGSWRATLIPVVTIPIALVGTFALIALFGFSINTLTLLALVMAIGLVVDDAIVVLENIFRYIEKGMKPVQAAIEGIKEIAFAVVAMTLTLAAVFAPLAFATGRTGKLFTEFALTLAGAVLISGLTALTLSPMMSSKLLKLHEGGKMEKFRHRVDAVFDRVATTYRGWLDVTLARRKLVLFGTGVAAVMISLLMWVMPSELSPTEDRGVFFTIMIAPEGSTPEYLDKYARRAEDALASIPEVAWRFIAVGFPVSTNAFAPTGLVPWEDRSRTQMEIVQGIFVKLITIPGILAFPINPPSLGGGFTSKPLELVIQTNGSYDDLNKIVTQVMEKAKANTNLVNLDSDLKLNKPELLVTLKRDKMADLGIGVDTLGRTLETMLGGRQVTRFKDGSEQYDVLVQLERSKRSTPEMLSTIMVRAANGEMVSLGNLVEIKEGVAPRELNHFNKLRSATISASLNSGYSLGEAKAFLEKLIRDAGGDKINIEYGGQTREYVESGSSMALMFVLALGFIYLVLSAQFESFVTPVTILVSVPLAVLGALLALRLTGGSMNVYSQIGLLTLVGLITKHGIMLVEFANALREKGHAPLAAIQEACMLRLRPILMTTAATVLGAIPLAMAHGAGAESREQIGWVIVGGMTVGTFLTLFVIPTVYILLARWGGTFSAGEQPAAERPQPRGRKTKELAS